jgi:predicted RNA-binding Zn-ribbon protein involved in translation (DUF1610 family)
MTDHSDLNSHVVAAAASCPVPGCGALSIAYSENSGSRRASRLRLFTCPRCGYEFVLPPNKLIFQSVPRDWLLARISEA